MSDVNCTLSEIWVYPIKSCAGVALDESLLIETGLELDRAWMVIDEHGQMITQRQQPRMTLIQPRFKGSELVLRAPGMLALHLRLDTVEAATHAQVWDDIVKAYDMGSLAAQWFSDYLGQRARLVRFDPEEQRLSSARWTGDIHSLNAFSDGFPLLVLGQASLLDLNSRLAAGGQAPVTVQRFRPNLVIAGLAPYDEDHLHELLLQTGEGPVTLRLVKPCVRCSIPNVDPASGSVGSEPGDTLADYRADPRMNGGITLGMNAIITQGIDCVLRTGAAVEGQWHFD